MNFPPLPPQAPIPTSAPAQAIQPPAPVAPAQLLQGGGGYGHNMTLAALVARQKEIADQQGQVMQQNNGTIPGGLAQMAWSLVNALGRRRAQTAEQQGTAEVADAFKSFDPATGMLSPDAMATVMRRAPDTGIDLYKTAMALRATQAKQDAWSNIPAPAGESGQWFRNATTGEEKKIGGSTEPATKLSDLGSLRDDYTKAATLYDAAAPTWQSMKDAASRSLDPSIDTKGKGASDYNIIVGLAKLLDPNSVVREGEVQSASNLGGMIDTINGYLKTVASQGSLSDDVRRSLLTEGYSRIKAYHDQVKAKHDWLSGVATRHGIDPNDVVAPLGDVTPYGETPPADPNAPAPPRAPATKDGQIDTTNLVPGQVYSFDDGTAEFVGLDAQGRPTWKNEKHTTGGAP